MVEEAHCRQAELTSGLSVGMSLPINLSRFVSVCHARGVVEPIST